MSCGKACKSTMILWVFLAALFSNAHASRQYVVAQSFALHQKDSGIDGTLQLLLDERLQSVQDVLWGKGSWDFALSPDSTLYKVFLNHPPVNSKLYIRTTTGRIIFEKDLDVPLARLEILKASFQDKKFFYLTVDRSSGLGSYSGLETTLFNVSGGTVHEVSALDVRTNKEEPIHLMKSLKSDWKTSILQGETEILSVESRPKDTDGSFVTVCARFSLNRGRWIKYTREQDGIWESDQPFPIISAFH